MRLTNYDIYNKQLESIGRGKLLITTINAYSFNVARYDKEFQLALRYSDILIPDGISIVWALKFLTKSNITKIAGFDLFLFEMEFLNSIGGSCFFLGSSEETLMKIEDRANKEYPNVIVSFFSPPYKDVFSNDENQKMLDRINDIQPDVLFVGMTAPKQEKWAYKHLESLKVGHVCCIGAVFDFYAGSINRAPQWMINIGLEWFFRFLMEPRRMWKRYFIGNLRFIFNILTEKFHAKRDE